MRSNRESCALASLDTVQMLRTDIKLVMGEVLLKWTKQIGKRDKIKHCCGDGVELLFIDANEFTKVCSPSGDIAALSGESTR